MRLYSRTEAASVDHAEFGHFEPQDDGGFDFPGPLADQLHSTHIAGKPAWETAIERQNRLIAEEAARRADPATLLGAVEQLVKAAQATQSADPAPAKRSRSRKAAGSDDAGGTDPEE
jgi:hypothetical protein